MQEADVESKVIWGFLKKNYQSQRGGGGGWGWGEKNPWHVVPVQERQEPSLAVLLGGCVPSYRNTNEKTMMVQGKKQSECLPIVNKRCCIHAFTVLSERVSHHI